MPIDTARARELLGTGDLRRLFIEGLGWDRHSASLEVVVDGSTVSVQALAQKRGMVAYQCPTPRGQRLPDYSKRKKIEHQIAKSTREHLIVFTDATNDTQIWQWVKRELGKPAACREHAFHRSQPGDALLQKLQPVMFSLSEEEHLSLPDVTRRTREGFDVERVTKRFYERFQKEHAAFLKFISGITEDADREWYASVMLNRLMFVYFIQRKGFLDGDREYLRNRLKRMRAEHGKDKFYSFYRYFLLRLFHEGLGGTARTPELESLVGRIPYLNGGLFDVHELEKSESYGKTIQIPDQAFQRIFDYFDQYQWYLDERPLRDDNEINPDVLGYIFEKYINQKQMGAYYTKEDITEYIAKNTVLPFLFDAAKPKCKIAFENPNGPTVWDLLKADPDRYIHPAVKHGVNRPLPPEISAGLSPLSLDRPVGHEPVPTLELRKGWNKSASPDHGLPTETWREAIGRRERYQEVRAKLAAGEIGSVNEFITLNLDVRQFAQDAIENCEGPDLLRAFWNAIEGVTILDPTCGSGAFLFAALTILEPLYEACLDRMEAFVDDLARSGAKHRADRFADFRKVLDGVAEHPNRRYFILKTIVLNSLFGVDIMEEAVEICKLRLFLKLAAQVEPDTDKTNLGIEPLPDIDFNIRAGNTLVGYPTYDDATRAHTSTLDFNKAAEKIALKAADLQQAFDAFRVRQVQGDGSVPSEDKQELGDRLKALQDELSRHLAREYGVEPSKGDAYVKWLKSHQPFHWFVEFYGVMAVGGFDVIIGNPPYQDLGQLEGYVPRGYATSPTKNLFSLVLERCDKLTAGRQGYIVPIAATATEGYRDLQNILLRRALWFASFDDRPAHLFDGLDKNTLSILLLSKRQAEPTVASSRLNRWSGEERPLLFEKLVLHPSPPCRFPGCLPRIGSDIEDAIWRKVFARKEALASSYVRLGGAKTYYSRKVNAFLQSLDFVPEVRDGRGRLRPPSEFKELAFAEDSHASAVLCLLNSTLFRWVIDVVSDGSHLNRREIDNFPFDPGRAADLSLVLGKLARKLSADLKRHSFTRKMTYSHDTLTVQCIAPKFSKSILDEMDLVLARYYGLTEEEVDFIINYDIKYRMGYRAEGEEEQYAAAADREGRVGEKLLKVAEPRRPYGDGMKGE